jgi:hypothetical protein
MHERRVQRGKEKLEDECRGADEKREATRAPGRAGHPVS